LKAKKGQCRQTSTNAGVYRDSSTHEVRHPGPGPHLGFFFTATGMAHDDKMAAATPHSNAGRPVKKTTTTLANAYTTHPTTTKQIQKQVFGFFLGMFSFFLFLFIYFTNNYLHTGKPPTNHESTKKSLSDCLYRRCGSAESTSPPVFASRHKENTPFFHSFPTISIRIFDFFQPFEVFLPDLDTVYTFTTLPTHSTAKHLQPPSTYFRAISCIFQKLPKYSHPPANDTPSLNDTPL
jgi:hypothetical protein